MFKFGIIGTENTHALAFAQIINLPDPATGNFRFPGYKVTGVYGPDPDSAKRVLEEGGAEFIAKDPGDFSGKVDGMFITSRKGSLHAGYALPFIKSGIPVFVDKPFTVDVQEAENLITEAKKSGCPLTGGSGLPLTNDVQTIKEIFKKYTGSGDFISASLNFTADPDSEYDGFFFYAPHLTEICLEIFGNKLRSLHTFQKNGSRISIWHYDDFDITLNFTKGDTEKGAALYTKKGNIWRDIASGRHIDPFLMYIKEAGSFIDLIETGKRRNKLEDLVIPVKVINAMETSVKTGKEVFIQ
jgi:predicted dehydrogenase